MAQQNNKPDAPEAGPENEVKDMDDKSINELLKEYAEDVKDKDLDDFLKDPADGDDAFDDGDDSDVVSVAEPKKKSGFLSFLLILIICGAAGAGAWMYLGRDDGMTNVMGGFSGGPEDDTAMMDTPPVPDAEPMMPGMETTAAPAADTAAITSPFSDEAVPAGDVPAPTPIMNETGAADAAAPVAEAPADLLAEAVTPAAETAPAVEAAPDSAPVVEATPAVDAADASQAVNDWMSSATDGMDETEAKLDAAAAAPAPAALAEVPADTPATDVAEVNAKPVDKTEAKAETAKVTRATSPHDDALPPPYVAIQAGKGTTTPAAKTETTAAAKMAPVVEGAASTSAEPTYKRGSTASTEPAETRASGVYKDLVKQGGGAIDLPGLTANVKNDITVGQAQPVRAPANAAVSMPIDQGPARLAIHGGKSLPPEVTARTATGTVTAKLPEALAQEPTVPAVPVEAVETESAPQEEPVAVSPRVESAPSESAPAEEAAAGEPSAELRITISKALAAEKSGDASGAIALYQRALELDAVQGGGLDRGMVYDRIGALRAQ